MTFPTLPGRAFSYTDFAILRGDGEFPGQRLDVDLDDIRRSIAEMLAFLKGIEREDAQLVNKIVHYDNLDDFLRRLLASLAGADFSALVTELNALVSAASVYAARAEAAAVRAEQARDAALAAAARAEAAAAAALASAAAAAASAAQASASADRSEAAALRAENAGTGGGGAVIYPTLASLAGLSPDAGNQTLVVAGSRVPGDNGGRLMVVRNRPDDPGHALKVQFANGRFGELVQEDVTPEMFGATGTAIVAAVGDGFEALRLYPHASRVRFAPGVTYTAGAAFKPRQGVEYDGRGAFLPGGIFSGDFVASANPPRSRIANFRLDAQTTIGSATNPAVNTAIENLVMGDRKFLTFEGWGSVTGCRVSIANGNQAGRLMEIVANGGPLLVEGNRGDIAYPGAAGGSTLAAAIFVRGAAVNAKVTVRRNAATVSGTGAADTFGLQVQDCDADVHGNDIRGGKGLEAAAQAGTFSCTMRVRGNHVAPTVLAAGGANGITLRSRNAGQLIGCVEGGNTVAIADGGAAPSAGVLILGLDRATLGPSRVTGPAGTLAVRYGAGNVGVTIAATSAVAADVAA